MSGGLTVSFRSLGSMWELRRLFGTSVGVVRTLCERLVRSPCDSSCGVSRCMIAARSLCRKMGLNNLM